MRKFDSLKYGFDTLFMVLPRVSGSFFSLTIIFLLTRFVSLYDFSLIQMNLGFAAIISWIGDLGSGTKMIQEYARKKFDEAKVIWFARFVRIILSASLFSTICILIDLKNFHIAIFFAGIFDLFGDSLISFRQIIFKQNINLVLQSGKKFTQLLLLIISIIFFGEITTLFVAIIIFFVAICYLIVEIRIMKLPKSLPNLRISKDSFLIWWQNGGTLFSGLDVVIIGNSGNYILLLYYSLAKRLANFLGIIAATYSVEILHDVTRSKKIEQHTVTKMRNGFILTILISILLVGTMPIYFPLITNRDLTTTGFLVMGFTLLGVSLGFLTSNINSILLGLNRYMGAALTTYLSTICFYLWLIFSPLLLPYSFVIATAIFVNLSIELFLQIYFLKYIKAL